MSSLEAKLSGSMPSKVRLGKRSCQAGPLATSESQRSERQRSAIRCRSTTRWGTPSRVRCSLMASPAWPPPITSVSICVTDIVDTPIWRALLWRTLADPKSARRRVLRRALVLEIIIFGSNGSEFPNQSRPAGWAASYCRAGGNASVRRLEKSRGSPVTGSVNRNCLARSASGRPGSSDVSACRSG